MRSKTAQIYDQVRAAHAAAGAHLLLDTCRLIVGEQQYQDVPCQFGGGSGDVDGASYRVKFAWGSPAVVEAKVIIDAIPGRPQLTLQLVQPADSSTGLWQEWQATSGPAFGRHDVGF
jgi:hypothetical protein